MTTSRNVHVLIVSGGINKSNKACESLTPHGYYGIEDSVVGAISHWMDTQN